MSSLLNAVEQVRRFINEYNVNAEILEFEGTVETVETASRLSGVEPGTILKTLVLKSGDRWFAVILKGDSRLDLRKLRRALGVDKIRFARPNELVELLGVEPGGVSPFLEGLKSMEVILDSDIMSLKGTILAGGGSKHHLVRTNVNEIIRVLNPEILDVS